MKYTLLLATLFALLLIPSFVFAQHDESVTVEYLSDRTSPVRIVSLKIGDIPVKSGEKTFASQDLIKELKATVENSYGKTVSFVELGVFVVRPIGQEDKPPFHYSICLGNERKALKQQDTGFKLVSDSENNRTELSLPDKEYDSIRTSLNGLGYPMKIEKLQIQIEQVAFTDGTIWSIGSWFRADPNDNGKLIRLNATN